jgi:hypothetical protein
MGSLRQSGGAPAQNLYAVSTTQLHPFGTTLVLGDGREFAYGSAGATALAVGRVVQNAIEIPGHGNTGLALNAPVAGTRVVAITTTTTAVTENQYAEGYLLIGDATTGGTCYKIAGHPSQAAVGAVNITLVDPLWETIAAAAVGILLPNPYKLQIITAAPLSTGAPTGIPVRDIPINNYGWFQTRGICGALQDGVIVSGNAVACSDGVPGGVQPTTATQAVDEPEIGLAIFDNANTDIGPIRLTAL